jgi:WD40 repeat protein
VFSAAVDPGGEWCLTTSADGSTRLWEMASRSSLLEIRDHTGYVHDAKFSPNGKRFVTAGADNTARVYECELIGSFDDLIRAAEARRPRALSPQEQRAFITWSFWGSLWQHLRGLLPF